MSWYIELLMDKHYKR